MTHDQHVGASASRCAPRVPADRQSSRRDSDTRQPCARRDAQRPEWTMTGAGRGCDTCEPGTFIRGRVCVCVCIASHRSTHTKLHFLFLENFFCESREAAQHANIWYLDSSRKHWAVLPLSCMLYWTPMHGISRSRRVAVFVSRSAVEQPCLPMPRSRRC